MNIRRALAVFGLAGILATGAAAPASAADCVNVKVVLAGVETTVCVPTVSLPKVTVKVPGPLVTVPVPGPTVSVPGPVRPIPGPTVTKTATGPVVNVPGPVKTVTSTATESPDPVTTSTSTASDGTKVITKVDRDVVTVTKREAVGISIALVVSGIILTLLALLGAYRLGWRLGDNGNRAFIREELAKARKH